MAAYKIVFIDEKYPAQHFPTEEIEIIVKSKQECYAMRVASLILRSLFDDSAGTIVEKVEKYGGHSAACLDDDGNV